LAATLAGRAALMLGKPWKVPEPLCERFPDASLRADLEAVRSRHLLPTDAVAARRAALFALHIAQRHGATASIAFARAGLAAVAEAQQRLTEARQLRSQAGQEAMGLANHLLLCDYAAAPVSQEQRTPITA
ncbi:MAG: hypothetical protein M3Z37_11520, partial [Candidatus Eremiobacteraeota bacterium]|nr:hypothetical protein [Candidatus Eremiobacteraeota bacterium]